MDTPPKGNQPEDFMCQDLCRGLTIWLSTRLGATAHLRASAALTRAYGVPREPNPIPPTDSPTNMENR